MECRDNNDSFSWKDIGKEAELKVTHESSSFDESFNFLSGGEASFKMDSRKSASDTLSVTESFLTDSGSDLVSTVDDVVVGVCAVVDVVAADDVDEIPDKIDPRASRLFFNLSLTLAVLFTTRSTCGSSILLKKDHNFRHCHVGKLSKLFDPRSC